MNDSKKTSSFLEAINKYAQLQSEEIRFEAEQIKQQAIERATQEGIKDAYKLIQKEISVKKAEIVSDIAIREQNSRKRLFDKRNEIVAKVFDEAKQKLIDFTKSDNYIYFLKKSAAEISNAFGENSCVVYVSSNDIDKADLIKSIITNATVECDNSIQLGGIKAYCEALSIVADNTIDTKLDEQKLWFRENSGLKVV